MYLKAIEMNGFKSFGEKRYIEFNRGITSVVGPNGSGKSNILDGVMWVLGELSYKNIRAKESQDVIYSGKKQVNKAEVSLYFDNSDKYLSIDSKEVKITRRLFRTGEGEYLINDIKCRLKDILDLFLDTGIGKTAYSVIGQGKVERIINSNPKEVKNIIEEAAGIKKFQSKRQECLKNLNNIAIKLESIEIILNEVRENKNRIEKQAQTAMEFIKIRDEKNLTLKTILLTEEKEKNTQLSENKAKEEENLKKVSDFKLEFEKNKSRLDEIDEEKISIREKIQSMDSKNKELKEEIDKKEIEKIRTTDRLKNLFDDKASTEENKISLENKTTAKEQEIEKTKENEKELKEKISSMEEENKKFEAKIEDLNKQITEKKDLVSLKNTTIRDKEIEKLNIVNDKDISDRRKKGSQDKIAELKADLKDLEEKYNKNKKEEDDLLDKKNKKQAELDKASKELSFVENEISNISRNINKLSESIRNYEYEHKIRTAKLEALIRMDENKEGLFKGVKEVLNSNIQGINGALISLINFDNIYTKAIENSASSNLQDVIVENAEVAKQAVEYLKNNKLGRASFLPLDIIKTNKKTWQGKIEGVHGVLAELVSYDKKYQKAIDFAFGNILVVDKIERAIQINKENLFSGNIVSIDGELVSQRGRISGGENQKSSLSQIMERKNEILSFKKNVAELEKNLARDTKEREKISLSLEKFENDLDSLSSAEENYSKQLTILNSAYEDAQEKTKKTGLDISRIKINIEEEERYLKEYETKIQNYFSEEEKIIQFIEKLKLEIQEDEKKQKELETAIKDLEYQFSDSRVLYMNTKDKLNSIADEKIKLSNELEEIKTEFNNSLAKMKNIEAEIEQKSSLEKELADFLEENLNIYHSENKDIAELNNREKDLSDEERTLLKLKSENESHLLYAEDDLAKTKEKINKIMQDLESIEEQLIDLQDLECEAVELTKLKHLKEVLRKSENALKNFGDVNLLAIEEFKELKDKYDFMSKERDDIVRSKKSLLDVIQDLDETIFKQFNEAYAEINNNFNIMCSQTIDNSEGRLDIINAEDFENCGIEIMVKFKNKKRQSLSLLSGGEKSMVAVSFIMSIFMYKPSPFTFLDEIEAALDKKNIVKLINKLKEFTDKSQFILITHNDTTMYESDRIIGVSMDKNIGISQVQYLNFENRGKNNEKGQQN